MRHLDKFLAKLEGVVRTPSGFKARCPCPDHGETQRGEGHGGDDDPSLSISLGEGDKILFNCFGNCKRDHVLESMGLDWQDLWPLPGERNGASTVETNGKLPRIRKAVGDVTLDADFSHKVNSGLLSHLGLSDMHRQNLRSRGLPDEQIDRRQYRSLTFLKGKQAARKLQEQFGDALLTVPGFKVERGAITSVTVPSGILIPVRDTQGRILAFQVRRDEGGKGSKYLWFSGGETSSGASAHVPLGVGSVDVVRVTEGPLKADVAFVLDQVQTIAVPGVTTWPAALPVLHALGAKVVRLAFDADILTKKSVASALAELHAALKE